MLGFIAEKISAGRNWSRWLFAAVFALGAFGFIASVLLAPQIYLSQLPVLKASTLVQITLQTAALAFMFSSASRQWFKTPRETTRIRAQVNAMPANAAPELVNEDAVGRCPNCSQTIPQTSLECPNCKALFGEDSVWKIQPL